MAINWDDAYADCPGTTANPQFEFVNESGVGVGDGTKLIAGHLRELYAFFNRLVVTYDADLSGDPEQTVPSGPANEQYWRSMIEMIRAYAGSAIGRIEAATTATAPTGTLSCDGSAVSRATYADLFGVISTTFGVGDGSTTFNLPDLRGVFLRGTGTHGTLAKANGTNVVGSVLGAYQNDMLQGFRAKISAGDGGAGTDVAIPGDTDVFFPALFGITGDGTNGSPRTGPETRPFSGAVHFVIRYS